MFSPSILAGSTLYVPSYMERAHVQPHSRGDLERAVDKMRDTLSTRAQDGRVGERTWALLKTYNHRSQSFMLERDDLDRYFKRSRIAKHFSGSSFPVIVVDMSSRSGGSRGVALEVDPTRGSTQLSAALTDYPVKTTVWEDGAKIEMDAHLDLYPEFLLDWEDFGPDAFDKFAAYVADHGDPASLCVRLEDIDVEDDLSRSHDLRNTQTISQAFSQTSRDSDEPVINVNKRGNGLTSDRTPHLGSGVALLHFGDTFIRTRSLRVPVSLTVQIHPEGPSETSTSESVKRVVRSVLAELGKLVS